MKFIERFRKQEPTVMQIAVHQLEEAQKDKLTQSKLREYHSSMEDMLTHRIDRLKNEIIALAQEQP